MDHVHSYCDELHVVNITS